MSLNRNGFQTRVNRQVPPAVIGQYASMNPRASALAGAGQFRSGGSLNYLSLAESCRYRQFRVGSGPICHFAETQRRQCRRVRRERASDGDSVPEFVRRELPEPGSARC
jgi:hypothetical protein